MVHSSRVLSTSIIWLKIRVELTAEMEGWSVTGMRPAAGDR
jgi:hypothetical protein